MKPDFLISTHPDFWPGLLLAQRVRAALKLSERASERFYGLRFLVASGTQRCLCEALRERVEAFLMEEGDKLWMEEWDSRNSEKRGPEK